MTMFMVYSTSASLMFIKSNYELLIIFASLSRLGTKLGRFLPTCARQLNKVAAHDTAYQKEILALTLA